MKNEVSKKEETNLAVSAPLDFAEMQSEMGVSRTDLIIPRLYLTQTQSPFVDENGAKAGDIFDSISREVVGNEKEPVELVLLKYYKTWVDKEIIVDPRNPANTQKKFVQQYPVTTANERQSFSVVVDGKTIERTFCVNVVAVPRPLLGEASLPHVITFKRTSLPAGRLVTNQIAIGLSRQLAPWEKTILLSAAKIPAKDGRAAYHVFTVKNGSTLSDKEKEQAASIYTRLKLFDIQQAAGTDDAAEEQAASHAAMPNAGHPADCGEEIGF